jgi:hypothetical protein
MNWSRYWTVPALERFYATYLGVDGFAGRLLHAKQNLIRTRCHWLLSPSHILKYTKTWI